jgi:hypothetical protein
MIQNKITMRKADLKGKVKANIEKMPTNGVLLTESFDGTVLTLNFQALPFEKAQAKVEQYLANNLIDFRIHY